MPCYRVTDGIPTGQAAFGAESLNGALLAFIKNDHSVDEERYITFGLSRLNRLVVISHTQRAEKTRIISARLMTRQERKIYEEG